MDESGPFRTPFGVLPTGVHADAPMAEVVLVIPSDDDEVVRVMALRPVVDVDNLDLAPEERRLETVASFAILKREFQNVFGDMVQAIGPPTPPGRNRPCYCGSGRKFKHCHGRILGA